MIPSLKCDEPGVSAYKLVNKGRFGDAKDYVIKVLWRCKSYGKREIWRE